MNYPGGLGFIRENGRECSQPYISTHLVAVCHTWIRP